jgi:hypothetical protein
MCKAYLAWACMAWFSNARRLEPSRAQNNDFYLDTEPLARLLLATRHPSPGVRTAHNDGSSLLRMRGGADPDLKAALDCNELVTSVLADAAVEVSMLREILSSGDAIANFGSKADMVMSRALERFDSETPRGDAKLKKLYEAKRVALEASLQNSLSPAFAQQICMLKGIALETFLKGLSGDADGASAMITAEQEFVQEASASLPSCQGFSFSTDRDNLVRSMQAILNERSKATEAKLKSSQQMQTAVTYLQMQQQQMRELQQQAMGAQGNKWSAGAAYRVPGTDINLSTAYHNGRCNVQVQLVPDEGANMLGPNGFTRGMGPNNLGLSFNIHM